MNPEGSFQIGLAEALVYAFRPPSAMAALGDRTSATADASVTRERYSSQVMACTQARQSSRAHGCQYPKRLTTTLTPGVTGAEAAFV